MSEDPRPKLIRDAFTAFAERDAAALAGFLHPEVESRVFPPLMNAGTWQGPLGFVEMTAGWEEAFGTITYDVRGIELLDERHALVDVHQTAIGASSGVSVELDVCFLVEFRGAQAIRFQIHDSRESAAAQA